jgi:hypothetical protein
MRVKPSEAVATVMAYVPAVAPGSGNPAPASRQTTVRQLISLIELRKTLLGAPDGCDHHVRSRVMGPGRN